MKQINLFGSEFKENGSKKYSTKVEAPIYKPRGLKPHPLTLFDKSKANRLIRKINESGVSDDEKKFLIQAAYRHVIFNYEMIADYYASSDAEMQDLMEQSGLVIIDFNKAIEYGYVKLCDNIHRQYLEEYGE